MHSTRLRALNTQPVPHTTFTTAISQLITLSPKPAGFQSQFNHGPTTLLHTPNRTPKRTTNIQRSPNWPHTLPTPVTTSTPTSSSPLTHHHRPPHRHILSRTTSQTQQRQDQHRPVPRPLRTALQRLTRSSPNLRTHKNHNNRIQPPNQIPQSRLLTQITPHQKQPSNISNPQAQQHRPPTSTE